MYEIGDIEYSCRSWSEMSHNKYPCLSQHERLSIEYMMSEIDFEINKDNNSNNEFIWGGW